MLHELSKILKRMGFSTTLNGYDYSRYAILLAIGNPALIRHMTTLLYPAVAEHFQVSASSVERCIRNAIESAWLRGDSDFNYDLFQYSIDIQRGKPTNSEFISVITEYFLIKQETESKLNQEHQLENYKNG